MKRIAEAAAAQLATAEQEAFVAKLTRLIAEANARSVHPEASA